MNMFVCLGVGTFSFSKGDMRVGATPVSSLGNGFSYTAFHPGEVVSGDERTENWFNSTEVGGTSTGSGLDMGSTAPDTDEILADSVTVAGDSVTFNNLITDDDDDSTDDDNQLPDSWSEGAVITLIVPDSFTVSASGQYSLITGNSLAEIGPYVGMPVSLTYNSIRYALCIATYVAATADAQVSVTLAYDSASGASFSGIPEGTQRLSVSHSESEYKLLAIDGNTVSVARLINGVQDGTWPGFSGRTALDFQASGINDSDTWLGPFLVCPENETTDCFEVNFSFPNGICGYKSDGSKQNCPVSWTV